MKDCSKAARKYAGGLYCSATRSDESEGYSIVYMMMIVDVKSRLDDCGDGFVEFPKIWGSYVRPWSELKLQKRHYHVITQILIIKLHLHY